MDQWTKWVRVKSCGKQEYNTAYEIVKVLASNDGYSYAIVSSSVARDLCIRHKFEICAPPKEKSSAPKPEPTVEAPAPAEEPAPAPKRRRRRKKASEE